MGSGVHFLELSYAAGLLLLFAFSSFRPVGGCPAHCHQQDNCTACWAHDGCSWCGAKLPLGAVPSPGAVSFGVCVGPEKATCEGVAFQATEADLNSGLPTYLPLRPVAKSDTQCVPEPFRTQSLTAETCEGCLQKPNGRVWCSVEMTEITDTPETMIDGICIDKFLASRCNTDLLASIDHASAIVTVALISDGPACPVATRTASRASAVHTTVPAVLAEIAGKDSTDAPMTVAKDSADTPMTAATVVPADTVKHASGDETVPAVTMVPAETVPKAETMVPAETVTKASGSVPKVTLVPAETVDAAEAVSAATKIVEDPCMSRGSCNACNAAGCTWCAAELSVEYGNVVDVGQIDPHVVNQVMPVGVCTALTTCAGIHFGTLKNWFPIDLGEDVMITGKVRPLPMNDPWCQNFEPPQEMARYATCDACTSAGEEYGWCEGAASWDKTGGFCIRREMGFLCNADMQMTDWVGPGLAFDNYSFWTKPEHCVTKPARVLPAPSSVCSENTNCQSCTIQNNSGDGTSGCTWCGGSLHSMHLPAGMDPQLPLNGVCIQGTDASCADVQIGTLKNLFNNLDVMALEVNPVPYASEYCNSIDWPKEGVVPTCEKCTAGDDDGWCQISLTIHEDWDPQTVSGGVCMNSALAWVCDLEDLGPFNMPGGPQLRSQFVDSADQCPTDILGGEEAAEAYRHIAARVALKIAGKGGNKEAMKKFTAAQAAATKALPTTSTGMAGKKVHEALANLVTFDHPGALRGVKP